MGAAAPLMGLAGTATSMAGGMVDMMGRQKAQQQQKQNLDNWYMYQALNRNQELMRQNALGIEANNARMAGLNDVGGIGQRATQQKEATRLNTALQRGTSAAATPASDASIGANTQQGALTGQSGGDKEFKSDLARRLNNRTQDAKGRIQALATMGSYGDSMGGLGNVNPLALQKAGWGINAANNARKGSLAAYGVERQIQPQQVQYQGSPLAMGLQSIGGLMSGMGSKGGGGGLV